VGEGLRRLVGLILIVMVTVPVFGLLDVPHTGLTGRLMVSSAWEHWRLTWLGLLAALAAGAIAAALLRGVLPRWMEWVERALVRPPRALFALGVGILAGLLTLWVAFDILDVRTVLNDASVQLIQARYFAAGRLAAPPLDPPEFWAIQFMIQTNAGWVAQYPPGQALALAAGFLIGAPWLIGPLAMLVTVLFMALSLERLLPERPATARAGALLIAVSPLLMALAASYMSHTTVGALAAVALYSALRAESGSWGWTVGAGAAVGAMVITRPLTGLIIGTVVTVGLWSRMLARSGRPDVRGLATRAAAFVGGGLPFAIFFGFFNRRFFGSPLQLGYEAASGPNHGLGFHLDPWGRPYGPAEGIGYASAELVALGRELLGTPVPLVALIGLYLLIAPRLNRAERLLLGWAALPILASVFYWHHDLVFGPRMLGEAAPAWCALAALAAVGLIRTIRHRWDTARWLPEAATLAFVLLLGFGVAYGGPTRLQRLSNRLGPEPTALPDRPALAFVHEAWGDRVGGRLSARGFRLDSVRTLLTRYPPCALQAVLDGVPPGENSTTCRREQNADARGAVGLTSLLWQGDLPGLPGSGVLWARDLGPEMNARLIERYPERIPLVLLPPGLDAAPGGFWPLVPYEEGMAILWPETGPGASP
jgi:hypothetical protein